MRLALRVKRLPLEVGRLTLVLEGHVVGVCLVD